MKAIVHIGTEKTGTTSIQRFLYLNREKLRSAGFHFIQSAGKTNNRAIPAYCLSDEKFDDFFRDEGIKTLEAKELFKKKFLKQFENEIRTLPSHVHTCIISSEHLHSRIQSEAEMENVHRLLSAYFNEIKIVCYLREQVATCTSFYSTHLKSGGTDSFETFLQRCRPSNYYFNYFVMLANWERCFGFNSLDISLFAPDRFLNGNLFDDFTFKLDPALIGQLDKSIAAENESLKPAGQALARAINIAFPVRDQDQNGGLRKRCNGIVAQGLTGKGQQPDQETWQSLYESFLEINEQLRKKFFPQAEQLFKPPDNVESLGVTFDERAVTVMTTLLDFLRNAGKNILSPDEYTRAYTIILSNLNGATSVGLDNKKVVTKAILNEEDTRLLVRAAVQNEKRDPDAAFRLMSLAGEIGQNLFGIKVKLQEYAQRGQSARKSHFLLTYYGGDPPSDAKEAEYRGMEFQRWLASLDVPSGSPFVAVRNASTVSQEGNAAAAAARKSSLLAFCIFCADSLDEALSIANSCPHLNVGGSLEVAEIPQQLGY